MLNSDAASSPLATLDGGSCGLMVPSPSEPCKIEMYLLAFYAACIAGGILSCGLTHMAVTPLDLVKCNIQIDPAKYKSILSGAQGACKFGFYEFFKKYYSDIAGPEYASKYKTLIYFAGSKLG
ncbi:Mitochondrial phosphate carrier protein 3 [Spatholobus suberectus]|nr:Mitochondrial phosphate carrier protein 3 [Spatholobus suberectus]